MAGRVDYQERKAARIERLWERAGDVRTEGRGRISRAQRVSSFIPMGQPILVGHHSEKRHRRDLAKIDTDFSKGFEALKTADALERRADNAEANRMISSDDPEAGEKIEAKIARLQRDVESMKLANKLIRAAKGNREKAIAALIAAGFPPTNAETLLTPNSFGDLGFPSFKLTNTGAEIRRLQKRVKALEHIETLAAQPDEQIGDVTLREENNRTQLLFPGKPAAELRESLKSHGFRWAPSTGAWQRISSLQARKHAKLIAERYVP